MSRDPEERSLAEVTATERTRVQGCRLRALRERLGIGKGVLIDALAFGSTQTYDLYERGVSVIRLDRVDDWAQAFGLSPEVFLGYVLGRYSLDEVTAPDTADPGQQQAAYEADVARRIGPHGGPALVEALVEQTRDRPAADRQTVLSVVERLLQTLPASTDRK